MADCELGEFDDGTKVQGTTLFTDGDCIQPTMIYLAKKKASSPLNVILWLHGFWVKKWKRQIFGPDETDSPSSKERSWNKLRESIDLSNKDVVLIAPYLGYGYIENGVSKGTYALGNLAKVGLQPYLEQIVGLIGEWQDITLKLENIGKLVIACHSGGGSKMQQLTKNGIGSVLGPKLAECWGFDCVYSSGHEYGCWADMLPNALKAAIYFYVYSANGTSKHWNLFQDFWRFAYGTPSNPEKQRMNNVFLSVALKNPALETLSDAEVFQSYEAIALKQQQGKPLTPYENLRLQLDPTLDGFDPTTKKRLKQGWSGVLSGLVKGHYQSVQDLFKPRVEGLFNSSKPTNIIAQIHHDACFAPVKTKAKKPALAGSKSGKK